MVPRVADPETMQHVTDAAHAATRSADGTIWGGVGAVLTATAIAVARRVKSEIETRRDRHDRIADEDAKFKESLRATISEALHASMREQNEAARLSLSEIVATLRAEGMETRHELGALGKAIAHLAGQVSRLGK